MFDKGQVYQEIIRFKLKSLKKWSKNRNQIKIDCQISNRSSEKLKNLSLMQGLHND